MRFGPHDDLISETMEIGERLLQWSKDQELPYHAYKQHLGGHRMSEWGGEAANQASARQRSPERRATEEYQRPPQKRARSREEEYEKTSRRRDSPVRSRERARRPSPRVERQPSPRPERRPSPRVERRQSPKGERRQSPQERPRNRGQREASPEKK